MTISTTRKPFILLFLILLAVAGCRSSRESGKSNANAASDKELRQLHSLFIDATKERVLGNYRKAESLYRECLSLNEKNAAVYYDLSQVLHEQGRYQESMNAANRAVELDPDNAWYLFLQAQLLEQAQQFGKAADVYNRLLKLEPDNLDFLEALAETCLMAGKANEALKAYDRIESIVGVVEPISLQKQKIYLAQKKYDKAVAEMEKLILAYPEEVRYYSILAETWLADGNKEKAMESYKRAIEIDPDDPYLHLSLSDYYRNGDDPEKAFEEIKLAFNSPTMDLDSKIQILLTYFAMTEVRTDLREEAFSLIEILRQQYPLEPKVNSIYGDFLYREDKLSEAREAFRKVIAVDSSRYAVWEQLLRINAELEDTLSLASEAERAVMLFPMQPAPFFFAGIANYEQRNFQKAVKYFKQGSGLVIDNDELLANFYSFLGDSYNQLKDNPASDEAYEKALKLKPENAYVLNNYSYYLSLRKEHLEKAETMAKKANEIVPDNPSYLDTHAWVLYQLNRLDEAEQLIRKALDKGGSRNPVILEHLGDILFKKGLKEQAVQYWRQATEAGKGSEFLERKVREGKLYE